MEEKKRESKTAKPKAPKILIVTGRRKTAVAQAMIKEGAGRITINDTPLEHFTTELMRMKIEEATKLAGELATAVDISVKVNGGGFAAQTAATRQAIARGLVEWNKSPALRNLYISYDRSLLVNDPRQTEPHKFSRSSKGARRKKQLSRR